MNHGQIALATTALLLAVAPASAGTLQFWEVRSALPATPRRSRAGPHSRPTSTSMPDSAEGGGLLFGATEIEIRPDQLGRLGKLHLRARRLHAEPRLRVRAGRCERGSKDRNERPRLPREHGIYDLGTIAFDSQDQPGSIQLVTCNYTGTDFIERTCNPFTLVSVPEPGAIASLVSGAALPLARCGGAAIRAGDDPRAKMAS